MHDLCADAVAWFDRLSQHDADAAVDKLVDRIIAVSAGVVIAEHCHCGADGAFGYLLDGRWQWFCASHRLRQWSADACRSEADANHARDVLGASVDASPDLQELIERAGRRYAASIGELYDENPFTRPPHQGGYQHITVEEWAEFDHAMAAWQARRREKLRRR
jgi:hypothetical protein